MANQGRHARVAGYWSGRKRVGDAEWGRYMRRVKGAKHANEAIRASGRVPGEEGRRAHLANCTKRKEGRNREQIAALSAGSMDERQQANEMILAAAAEQEAERVERLRSEREQKQRCLREPARADGNRIGRTNMDGI